MAFKHGWQKAFKLSVINPDFFVLREREREELFPWEIISHGLKREFLYEEYQRALKGQPSLPCPMRECSWCGVCKKTGRDDALPAFELIKYRNTEQIPKDEDAT
jgi:hypothetical protein